MSAPTRRSALAAALFGRGAVARVMAALLLVLQGFVTGAVPVLDGRADHSQKVVIHVEDAQEQNCPASHDSDACQLCQVIASRAVPLAQSSPVPSAERAHVVPSAAARAPGLPVFLVGNTSRAPPRI